MKTIRCMVLVLLLGLLVPAATQAQTTSRFFPETGRTVSGRFLDYWNANGGLAVFGFPLTEQFEEQGRSVQYFERQRFEAHPENARPYDVLLGRLGAQLLGPLPPPADIRPQGCLWFPETQHNVCNQQGSLGFASYWQRNGLEFEGSRNTKTYRESLALFGFPLTEPLTYTNSSGQTITAQWFERARFEWHPTNPDAYKVLLGRLGADVVAGLPVDPTPVVRQVKLFLIAVGDNGSSGKLIGCGDSVLGVTRDIEPTPAPLRAALLLLFANKDQFYGESGFYNALYQSDLKIDSLAIANGKATVQLSGTLRFGGTCDTPRVKAQIEETVRQFASITSADIFVNGVPLAQIQ